MAMFSKVLSTNVFWKCGHLFWGPNLALSKLLPYVSKSKKLRDRPGHLSHMEDNITHIFSLTLFTATVSYQHWKGMKGKTSVAFCIRKPQWQITSCLNLASGIFQKEGTESLKEHRTITVSLKPTVLKAVARSNGITTKSWSEFLTSTTRLQILPEFSCQIHVNNYCLKIEV